MTEVGLANLLRSFASDLAAILRGKKHEIHITALDKKQNVADNMAIVAAPIWYSAISSSEKFCFLICFVNTKRMVIQNIIRTFIAVAWAPAIINHPPYRAKIKDKFPNL